MASAFDRMMDTVRPHLPGAMDRAIKQELFLLCHDFLKYSTAWRDSIQFTILANTTTATVTPVAGRIHSLLAVTDANGNNVNGVYMEEPGAMKVRIAPAQNTTYTGLFALTVVDPVDVDTFPIVPVDLVERYTEEFVNGIKAKMMVQPSKPYTNPAMAQFYINEYKGGRSRARNDVNTGFTYGSQRWAFPQTFRV